MDRMDSDTTDKIIFSYFLMGLNQSEILVHLACKHDIIISMKTLKRILNRLNLYRRKFYSRIEDVEQFIKNQVQFSGQLHGYRWMHLKCIQNGLVVTQETVRNLLKTIDPEGVQIRKRRRLRRRQYNNKGPNFVWHMDSYDKLKPYGICINGCIDGFSRYIIWLQANKTSSDPKVIAGYYINSVEVLQGCPRRIRSDMGTENCYVEQMQTFFRSTCSNANESDENTYFLYGSSPANQRIEAWWSILRTHHAQFWMNLFQKIKEDGHFSGSFLDKALVQFCFLKIIQNELDIVVFEWNSHKISKSRNAIAPSGRPFNMYELPQLYDTFNYIVKINEENIALCKDECVFIGETDLCSDKDVYELCLMIMEEKGLVHPSTSYEAVDNYVALRNELNMLLF